MKTNKHGGSRKGAGKPAQFSKPMKRKEVMLPDEAIEFFTSLGDGNFSEGIRKAWRSLTPRAADGSRAALDEQVQAMIVESIWGGG